MPIALVQEISSSTNSSTTITTTFAAPPTDGNLLILILPHRIGSGLALNITGGPWEVLSVEQFGETFFFEVYYKIASGNAAAVTATFENGHRAILGLAEYSGISPNNQVDQFNVSDFVDVSSLRVAFDNPTEQADELLFSAFVHFGGTTTPTWTDSFTNQDDRSTGSGKTHLSYQWADRIVAAIGTYETTAGWTPAERSSGIIASFRAPVAQAARSQAIITT